MPEDSIFPYACGEPECVPLGVQRLTMPEITAHRRGHEHPTATVRANNTSDMRRDLPEPVRAARDEDLAIRNAEIAALEATVEHWRARMDESPSTRATGEYWAWCAAQGAVEAARMTDEQLVGETGQDPSALRLAMTAEAKRRGLEVDDE